MKIKMLERVVHLGQVYEEDEIRVVGQEVGSLFCSLGWAEDTEGNVPTGERDTRPRRIAPITSCSSAQAVP